jgi:hypothetical protein
MLDYDATRDALYKPYLRPTVFKATPEADHARLGVEAARLAYWPAEKDAQLNADLTASLARIGFDAPSLFNDVDTGTQGYAAFRAQDGLALVAFRGTEPDAVSDLASDLAFSMLNWVEGSGRVHDGFAKAARSALPWVKDWLGQHTSRQSLLITGHSLGAAIATLVSSVCKPTTLVTIGSPRVGDQAFVESLQGIAIHRFVNCCDAVTRVPPKLFGYEHAGPAIHILSDGALMAEPIDDARLEQDRNSSRQQHMEQYAWRRGCVLIRDLADHAPINYVRALFPEL